MILNNSLRKRKSAKKMCVKTLIYAILKADLATTHKSWTMMKYTIAMP